VPSQDYDRLLENYRAVTTGIKMIREVVELTFGRGLLPAGPHTGPAPVHECEGHRASDLCRWRGRNGIKKRPKPQP